MSILSLIGVGITLGVQAGVAWFNQKWNSENADAIRRLQREQKENAQKKQLQRDREKFERSRELQIMMEIERQKERLRNLDQDFINSFKKMAHNATLASHYPLKVSPYIIGKTVLPISDAQLFSSRQEILCILTTSNNSTFNKEVLPYLDEELCQIISRCWTGRSLNNICYYQDMWDRKKDYCDEDIDNVKAVVNSPTVTMTPFFIIGADDQQYLKLKIQLWGMGCECCELVETGIVYPSLPHSYTIEDIKALIGEILPIAICVIGQLVDVFYWTMYNQAPMLPHLVACGAIVIPQKLTESLKETYSELYKVLSLGCDTSHSLLPSKGKEDLELNALTSLFNFPERSISFLKSCIELTKESNTSNQIIEDTARALYHARTQQGRSPISLIDVRMLDYDDMSVITTLINIANKSGNKQVAKKLLTLISRKIES